MVPRNPHGVDVNSTIRFAKCAQKNSFVHLQYSKIVFFIFSFHPFMLFFPGRHQSGHSLPVCAGCASVLCLPLNAPLRPACQPTLLAVTARGGGQCGRGIQHSRSQVSALVAHTDSGRRDQGKLSTCFAYLDMLL